MWNVYIYIKCLLCPCEDWKGNISMHIYICITYSEKMYMYIRTHIYNHMHYIYTSMLLWDRTFTVDSLSAQPRVDCYRSSFFTWLTFSHSFWSIIPWTFPWLSFLNNSELSLENPWIIPWDLRIPQFSLHPPLIFMDFQKPNHDDLGKIFRHEMMCQMLDCQRSWFAMLGAGRYWGDDGAGGIPMVEMRLVSCWESGQ